MDSRASVCDMAWTSTMTLVQAWWNLNFQLNRRGYCTEWAWTAFRALPNSSYGLASYHSIQGEGIRGITY